MPLRQSLLLFSQQLLFSSKSCVQLFVTIWTIAHRASLFFTISQSLLKRMSIVSVMPSNQLTLCHLLLFLPSMFLSIRVFSSESALHIRWAKYQSFSFTNSPSNECIGELQDIFICAYAQINCGKDNSVQSDSLRPYGLQHTRPPCPSPTPGVYTNSCSLSR